MQSAQGRLAILGYFGYYPNPYVIIIRNPPIASRVCQELGFRLFSLEVYIYIKLQAQHTKLVLSSGGKRVLDLTDAA